MCVTCEVSVEGNRNELTQRGESIYDAKLLYRMGHDQGLHKFTDSRTKFDPALAIIHGKGYKPVVHRVI